MAVRHAIINQLNAHGIAGDDQPLSVNVPDSQSEHAIEMIEDLFPPLLITMDNHFRVGARPEDVSSLFEFRTQFLEVINLAVQDDPYLLLRVGHRLVPAGQIDNRQPPKAEPNRAVKIVSLVIRATMDHGLGHAPNRVTIHGFVSDKIKLAANTAHSV